MLLTKQTKGAVMLLYSIFFIIDAQLIWTMLLGLLVRSLETQLLRVIDN